jgi:hypothetical protein
MPVSIEMDHTARLQQTFSDLHDYSADHSLHSISLSVDPDFHGIRRFDPFHLNPSLD